MIVHTGTYFCHFVESKTTKDFPSLEAAQQAAVEFVGNSSYAKPFPRENTYFYGPGDGTTTVMVREHVRFE